MHALKRHIVADGVLIQPNLYLERPNLLLIALCSLSAVHPLCCVTFTL